MGDTSAIIFRVRRDLRLADHPGLAEAAATGRPVIPVFIHDDAVDRLGAAARFRFGLGIGAFAERLGAIGSRLVLRRGGPLQVLRGLIAETGAGAVWWQRSYDPAEQDADRQVKAALKGDGIDVRSFAGHLLFEPWTVETGAGGFYKVYTPFWNAVKQRAVAPPVAAVSALRAPADWPDGDRLDDWAMGARMRRGARVVARHVSVGEAAAQGRLGAFIAQGIADYRDRRNLPAENGTSGLSEPLTYGEISPRVCWHAGLRAREEGKAGAETWLKELVWREFAYHLLHHTPQLARDNWRPEWDGFPWNEDPNAPEVAAWQRGRTGEPFVDAAMRELYVTGRMHNRARMIVASYLTKHLLTHWRIGLDWFADTLVDWDPAANALGWQWVAGSGPDAAPYFRVFNPATQREKFDTEGAYLDRWLAEGRARPTATALSFFNAVPKRWGLSPDDARPDPVVALDVGRKRALDAYQGHRSGAGPG